MLEQFLNYVTGNLYKQEEAGAENYIRNFLGGERRRSALSNLRGNRRVERVINWACSAADLVLGCMSLNSDIPAVFQIGIVGAEMVRCCANLGYGNYLRGFIRKRDNETLRLRYHSLEQIQERYDRRSRED